MYVHCVLRGLVIGREHLRCLALACGVIDLVRMMPRKVGIKSNTHK